MGCLLLSWTASHLQDLYDALVDEAHYGTWRDSTIPALACSAAIAIGSHQHATCASLLHLSPYLPSTLSLHLGTRVFARLSESRGSTQLDTLITVHQW